MLSTATHVYPDDAGTEFALGSALELLNDEAGEAKAYSRAIALEEDFTAAYASLGLISYSSGGWKNAIAIFRRGLRINPLSAELNYDLGLALTRSGDAAGAQQAFALARRLRPSDSWSRNLRAMITAASARESACWVSMRSLVLEASLSCCTTLVL